MTQPNLTKEGRNASRSGMEKVAKALLAAAALSPLGGCVQVSAPERPIEINLNINIRQEVVVRLQGDVRELIERNPGVF
jgi:hypothetical protein